MGKGWRQMGLVVKCPRCGEEMENGLVWMVDRVSGRGVREEGGGKIF